VARVAARFVIRGRVQGVGYRWWAAREATRLSLDGWVRNRRDGSVELLAAGEAVALLELEMLCHGGPAAARVASVERLAADQDPRPGFEERATA
jgi:acylphosphatase